ncbi:hypothetical protein [Gilliamella sp. wkB178]|nr:hypothetical protein [Gilliamella apicola]
MAVIADLAVIVLMIVAADWGDQVADYADGTGLNWELNYHFGEMS